MSLLKDADKVKKTGVKKFRLAFTIENGRETERVLDAFVSTYKKGEVPKTELLQGETTKGHFGRGVE